MKDFLCQKITLPVNATFAWFENYLAVLQSFKMPHRCRSSHFYYNMGCSKVSFWCEEFNLSHPALRSTKGVLL